MNRSAVRFVLFFAVLMIMVLGVAQSAFADLSTPPDVWATTKTNPAPAPGQDSDNWWREGWGTSLQPQFKLNPPKGYDPNIDGLIIGMLYYVDRTPAPATSTVINTATPASYYRATWGGANANGPYGTNFDTTYDLLGIWHDLGAGGGPTIDGIWWLHYTYFTTNGVYSPTFSWPFGVDRTPPGSVANLTIKTGLNGPVVNTWQPYSRAMIHWNAGVYDALSGVGYYQVRIDDADYIPETSVTPVQGRVYEFPPITPSDVTIENMPPGQHKVSIVCVDRATNEGAETSTVFYSDPDTPTVRLTSPLDGNLRPGTIISADASDLAGPPLVKFYIDGARVATVAAPPYEYTPNLAIIPPGAHTIAVTATDHMSRTTTFSTAGFGGASAPEVNILHPTSLETYGKRGSFSASVFDIYGIKGVGFRIDGAIVSTWTPVSIPTTAAVAIEQTDISALTPGVHTLTVRAVNLANVVSTDTVNFTYDPTALPSYFDFVAMQAQEDTAVVGWLGESPTNPGHIDDLFGRQGWGNTVYPQFAFDTTYYNSLSQAAMLYTVDRVPDTVINTATPDLYRRSVKPDGTHLDQTIDLLSILSSQPTTLDGSALFPGQALRSEEGIWYLHFNWLGGDGSSSGTHHATFGIDVTPPSKPVNVTCYASAVATSPLSGLVQQGAVHVRWDAKEYDALSGTWYFKVYVDGVCRVPEGGTVGSPAGSQGVPWYTGAKSGSLTLEDLASGTHTVQVAAVDRAGNESVMSDPFTFTMDSDIPTVNITNPPPGGATFTMLSVPAATAHDAAGVTAVGFAIDGSAIGTLPAGGVQSFDASLAVNWTPYSNGSHTLAVTAVDLAGHTFTTSRAFVLDKTQPKPDITILSPASDGATLTAADPLSASANDIVGVTEIGFYVDGSAVGTVPAGGALTFTGTLPFTWAVPFGTGPHTLVVKALNLYGNVSSATRPFILDQSLPVPVVKITLPASGQTFGSPAPFTANVSDPTGILTVAFSVDSTPVGTWLPPSGNPVSAVASVLADLSGFPAGMHTLHVTAFDTLGHSTQSQVTFFYDPTAPPPVPQPSGPGMTVWKGTTLTNPNDPEDSKAFWREGWGHSMYPQLTITSPSYTIFDRMEMMYVVDRYQNTQVNPAMPNIYSIACRTSETLFDGVYDIGAALNTDFDSFNGISLYPGRAFQPGEGVWWWHVAMVHDGSVIPTDSATFPMGIDMTPPAKVQNVKVYASPTAASPISGWSAQGRAHVRWTATDYDLLSGTSYFRVYLDGKCVAPGAVSVEDPASGDMGVPWYAGATSGALTLEKLSSGTHRIQVSAVDRAANEGPLSDPFTLNVDSDYPGVTILTPKSDGGYIGVTSPLSAVASDSAGVKAVGFLIDGSVVGTATASTGTKSFTAQLTPNWASIPSGSHFLQVRALDVGGHITYGYRSFILDKSVPGLSISSAGPSPFYPRIREGYKDNYVVKFSSNKNCTAYMCVTTSTGKAYRTLSTSIDANSPSQLAWNGRSSSGALTQGTFKVKIKVVDAAGNSRTSAIYSAKIAFYELVRTGSGTVKVVSR